MSKTETYIIEQLLANGEAQIHTVGAIKAANRILDKFRHSVSIVDTGGIKMIQTNKITINLAPPQQFEI